MAFEIYPFFVGHARCYALKDGESVGAAERAFQGADQAELAAAAERHGFDPHEIALSYTCLLIELGGVRVLIDSGAGGRLFALLGELGLDPGAIDVLVLSHAHADHYAGHLDPAGGKRFPDARYLMWRDEWRHHTSAERLELERERLGERFAAIEQTLLPLGPLLEWLDTTNPEIAPGIRAVPAPGHTRHHVAVELDLGAEVLLFVGDAALHPLAFERPAWGYAGDADPEQAALTRRVLANRAMARDALVMGYHFPFPGLGKLWYRRDGLVWGPRRLEGESEGGEGSDGRTPG